SDMARGGRRVIVVAGRNWNGDTLPKSAETAERDLQILGAFGIVDPIRPEAAEAIAECRSAGIRAVMITGDHPDTALSIGKDVGLQTDAMQVLTGPELEKLSDDV